MTKSNVGGIILLGPPASGKGTQGAMLAEHLGIPKIATGDMLRSAVAAGTELGKKAGSIMASGGLVPDEVVIGLVGERLAESDAAGGFILDGFPRTVAQAQALQSILAGRDVKIETALEIRVPRELLVERATLRRTDVRSGQIYHLKYNPPPEGVEVEHRKDDQEETVNRRLDAYEAVTSALVPFYEETGILQSVDGTGSFAEVKSRVFGALGISDGGTDAI